MKTQVALNLGPLVKIMSQKFGNQTEKWTKWTNGASPSDGMLSTEILGKVREKLEEAEKRHKKIKVKVNHFQKGKEKRTVRKDRTVKGLMVKQVWAHEWHI